MTEERDSDTTELLSRAAEGDEQARSQLYEVLYEELRRTAHIKMGQSDNQAGHTLQPTALVNETFLRLGVNLGKAQNRRHFFGVAGRAMEQILIEHHRKKATLKRGGEFDRVPLDDMLHALYETHKVDIEALHESIELLEKRSELQADIVRRKFFSGQTHPEIACDLECSVSTIEEQWRIARAWLRGKLKSEE